MTDHFHEAHKAAEDHLQECWESIDNLDVDPETMAPFCGCTTCEVREILFAAMPHLEKGIRQQIDDEARALAGRLSQ